MNRSLRDALLSLLLITGAFFFLSWVGYHLLRDPLVIESVEIPEARKTNWFHKYIDVKRDLLRVELELIYTRLKFEKLRDVTLIESLETPDLLLLMERVKK